MGFQQVLPANMIRPSYIGQPLLDFLYTTKQEPDTTLVVFDWMPNVPRDDGTVGPPMIPLGRIREEFIIRTAFPHEAATFVR